MPVILLGQRFQACPLLAMNHMQGESISWCQGVNYALLDSQDLSAFIICMPPPPLLHKVEQISSHCSSNCFILTRIFYFYFCIYEQCLQNQIKNNDTLTYAPLHFHRFFLGFSVNTTPNPGALLQAA